MRGLYSANLFAAVQALSSFECRKALISPNRVTGQQFILALPKREQYMRQAKRRRIYAEAESNASYLQLPRREQYMWPPGQIYAEAVPPGQIYAEAVSTVQAGGVAQYMWRASDKYTQKSSAQTCLQLQRLRIYVMCQKAHSHSGVYEIAVQ